MSFYEALQANTNNVRYDVNFDDINVNTINGNVPPVITAQAVNSLPTFTGSLNPVLQPSNMSIIQNPLGLISGSSIDLDRSNPITNIIFSGDTVFPPDKLLGIVANAQSNPVDDCDLILVNNSTTNHNIGIFNQSANGVIAQIAEGINLTSMNALGFQVEINGNLGLNGQCLISNGSGSTVWGTPQIQGVAKQNTVPQAILTASSSLLQFQSLHLDYGLSSSFGSNTTFTSPSNGFYKFCLNFQSTTVDNLNNMLVRKNGTPSVNNGSLSYLNNNNSLQYVAQLNLGDTLDFQINNNSGVNVISVDYAYITVEKL